MRRLANILVTIVAVLVEVLGRFLAFFFGHARWTIPITSAVILAGLGVGALNYTENPSFCTTCHVMRPYYESWRDSSHNFTRCVECHYEPGIKTHIKTKFEALVQVIRYLNGTYDPNFYAEISDASCLRGGCHDKRLLYGTVAFKEGIVFDHTDHLAKRKHNIQLRCTSCHSQIVQGSHIAVTEEACFICHFKDQFTPTTIKGAEFCTACHQPPAQTIDIGPVSYNHELYVGQGVECQRCHKDVVQGDAHVDTEACMFCHSDFNRIAKVRDPERLHDVHVTDHKVECFECHSYIKHEVAKTVDVVAQNCDTCHANKHLGPRSLYMGVGGRGVPNMPAAMFLAQVDCVGCHTDYEAEALPEEFGEQTALPSTVGCEQCHGSSGLEAYRSWTEQLAKADAETLTATVRAERALSRVSPQEPAYQVLERKLADAHYNYEFVHKGKGVHNVPYSLKLLAYARKMATEVVTEASER